MNDLQTPKKPQVEQILDDVIMERCFQDIQWGGPTHDDTHTAEEWFGYMAHQANNYTSTTIASVRRSYLVKIAALAVAALESYDRAGEISKRT